MMGSKYNSREDTEKHIETVKRLLFTVQAELNARGHGHDRSKLSPDEKKTFDEFTPKLKDSTYGSDEYKTFLAEMKPALDHHYENNRHHPEHFQDRPPNKIIETSCLERMNLVDLVEMFCDWKAATMRHNNGDILKSIDINQKRFGYSDELASIFRNTAELLNNTEE